MKNPLLVFSLLAFSSFGTLAAQTVELYNDLISESYIEAQAYEGVLQGLWEQETLLIGINNVLSAQLADLQADLQLYQAFADQAASTLQMVQGEVAMAEAELSTAMQQRDQSDSELSSIQLDVVLLEEEIAYLEYEYWFWDYEWHFGDSQAQAEWEMQYIEGLLEPLYVELDGAWFDYWEESEANDELHAEVSDWEWGLSQYLLILADAELEEDITKAALEDANELVDSKESELESVESQLDLIQDNVERYEGLFMEVYEWIEENASYEAWVGNGYPTPDWL